jgi:hypothetical protein
MCRPASLITRSKSLTNCFHGLANLGNSMRRHDHGGPKCCLHVRPCCGDAGEDEDSLSDVALKMDPEDGRMIILTSTTRERPDLPASESKTSKNSSRSTKPIPTTMERYAEAERQGGALQTSAVLTRWIRPEWQSSGSRLVAKRRPASNTKRENAWRMDPSLSGWAGTQVIVHRLHRNRCNRHALSFVPSDLNGLLGPLE